VRGVDISLAGGWIEVASIVHPPGEVVVSMRPVSVFAKGPGSEIEQLRSDLQGRWRQATRAVMVLLSVHGLAPAQIAELLDCHPATVRRWISRFNREGIAGLAGRPRSGRPRLGGRRLAGRIAALLERPGPWTLPQIRRYLGWPRISARTLYRRVRLVAIWRRPKLTARGDPDHDHVVAGIGRAPTGDPIVVSVVQVKALSNSRARSPSSSAITRNLAAASDTLPRKRIVNDFTSRFRGDAHRAAYGTRASCHVTM